MDLRINETRQTGVVRIPPLPFSRLVGTVSNCAYAVPLETAPTGGESVYLFLEFTINVLERVRGIVLRFSLLPIRLLCYNEKC